MTTKTSAGDAHWRFSQSFIKISIPSSQDTVDRHAELGWQCPECYGVQVSERTSKHFGHEGWLCEECGCQWGSR